MHSLIWPTSMWTTLMSRCCARFLTIFCMWTLISLWASGADCDFFRKVSENFTRLWWKSMGIIRCGHSVQTVWLRGGCNQQYCRRHAGLDLGARLKMCCWLIIFSSVLLERLPMLKPFNVKAIVDIIPAKQGKWVSVSRLPVLSPLRAAKEQWAVAYCWEILLLLR